MMNLSIVIVNYNAGDLILTCLQSIIKETQSLSYEVIVVDNDSTDDSIEKIKQQFPEVQLIETGQNTGFAAGNNIGFKAAIGDYILVLNPDTVVTDHAIDKAMAYMKHHADVGILGCKVLWETGEHQSTLMRFPALMPLFINIFIPYKIMRKNKWLGRTRYAELNPDKAHDVDVVAGCFMLLPASLINDVGMMDEDFFMFGEEVEWCWRTHQQHKKVRYYPDSTIIHTGGGCSSSLSYRKALLMEKGTLMVLKKTRGPLLAKLATVLMILRDAPRAMIWGLLWLIHHDKANQRIALKTSSIRLMYLLPYLIGYEKEI